MSDGTRSLRYDLDPMTHKLTILERHTWCVCVWWIGSRRRFKKKVVDSWRRKHSFQKARKKAFHSKVVCWELDTLLYFCKMSDFYPAVLDPPSSSKVFSATIWASIQVGLTKLRHAMWGKCVRLFCRNSDFTGTVELQRSSN